MNISALNANWDNWVYLHPYSSGRCWVVDPSDASVVLQAVKKEGLVLTHILATHHHGDHTAGIAPLKKAFSATVVSADPARIPDTDIRVSDGETLMLGDWTLTVIAAPGHTATSVCYFGAHPTEPPVLYAGDTLFACGCGRLFEGSARQMYDALQTLAALPEDTRLYPGHNYTEENIRFALTLEPDNPALAEMLRFVRMEKAFFATTLAQEKQCNPFLRTGSPAIQKAVGRTDPVEVFAELRRRKDHF